MSRNLVKNSNAYLKNIFENMFKNIKNSGDLFLSSNLKDVNQFFSENATVFDLADATVYDNHHPYLCLYR